jgi:hypothetical protein
MSIAGELERLLLAAAIESDSILLSSESTCKQNFHASGGRQTRLFSLCPLRISASSALMLRLTHI